MAICVKCNGRDREHELSMPSKRYELQGSKKIEICDGFSSIPKDFFTKIDEEKQKHLENNPPKVIA